MTTQNTTLSELKNVYHGSTCESASINGHNVYFTPKDDKVEAQAYIQYNHNKTDIIGLYDSLEDAWDAACDWTEAENEEQTYFS